MEERARRIVETAVELAEKGGFEAVRLRDVASHAEVALGTLYRRFRSKEDVLIAAFELETEELERRIAQRPAQGEDPIERVSAFFGQATRGLLRRPNLARALLKAAAAGDADLAKRTAAFHDRVHAMVVASVRGWDRPARRVEPADADERAIAETLTRLWFSLLVGWSGGLYGQAGVIEEMGQCVELILLGAEQRKARRAG
ncbi:MAG: helix-turn-helix domain-containing protein [Myxococcota bacterium]|nr:helix-turn-helix domain-containing protein [Myxococcota bacterium]